MNNNSSLEPRGFPDAAIRGLARVCVLALCVDAAAALSTGCSATSRHKTLTFLFDGVPPLKSPGATEAKQTAASPNAPRPRLAVYREHGPYAAKLCNACHQAGATNALIEPGERLCYRCHALRLDKRYIHGPIASGGCLVCHDPHSSRFRYLLVSESDAFCLRCHDPTTVARISAHDGRQENCTACHDAHMSDRRFLLK